MSKEEIERLIAENPQKLIDDNVVLSFEQIEGDARLVDGVAAGGPWLIFTFDTGPYAGKKIACTDDHYGDGKFTFTYLAHSSDDGMLFNKDPARFDPAVDDAWGGDFIPELDGLSLTLKERNKMRYEIEILEERVGDAQRLSDALHLLFEVSVTDIVMGPNGNPSLLVAVPEDWHCERSFKLWLLERPNLTGETAARLDPILAEVDETHGITDEQYYALVEGEKNAAR